MDPSFLNSIYHNSAIEREKDKVQLIFMSGFWPSLARLLYRVYKNPLLTILYSCVIKARTKDAVVYFSVQHNHLDNYDCPKPFELTFPGNHAQIHVALSYLIGNSTIGQEWNVRRLGRNLFSLVT
jgi:hypothetical protein